jgi:Bacterial Ig domain
MREGCLGVKSGARHKASSQQIFKNEASISPKLSLWAGLLFLLFSFIAVPMASAQLARVGPVDPANQFPRWYQDKTGLALDHCLPQNQAEIVWCLLPPIPNGTAPEIFPTNWAIENFYADATSGLRQAVIPGTNQTTTVLLIMDLESSFANGFNIVPGDQVVFARTRIKLSPIPFDGTYTVYTPLGKFVFESQIAGDRLFFTEDIGLAAAGDFTKALDGRMGPFLLPSTSPGGPEVPPIPLLQPGQDPFYDALLAAGGTTAYPGTGRKYIADPGRIGPITGGKTGTADRVYTVNDGTTRDPNIFRVEGPNGFSFETTDFALMGRVYEGPISGDIKVNRASYASSAADGNKVDVYATASPSTQGRLPAGAAPATVSTQLSYFDAACTPTLDANGNPGPPYSAPAGAAPHQMFASGSNYFGQSNPVALPLEVCVEGNSVNSAGQTISSFMPALLGDQVFITEALYDPASQSLSVKASSSDQVTLQTLTVEGFGAIPATGQLIVNPLLAPPATVKVLSSGSGLNEMQVSTGAVAGGAATAPVAVNDTATVFEDCSATTSATACATPLNINVLANDTAAAGGTVTVVSPPVLGTATVNADGSISYTPKLNANGTDSFTYHVTVGTQVSNDASVTVTITPVNDLPVAINDTAGALRGVSNSINVLANDNDPDGAADLAGVQIVNGNANLGIASGTLIAGAVVTFTPPSTTPAGPYTFTYTAIDKSGAASATPATVTVNLSTTEAIVPAKAIYTQSKGRWTLSGTISPVAGQTITMTYVDGIYKVNGTCPVSSNAAGTVIATATADALGNWLYDQVLTNTAGVLNPSNSLGNSTGFWCTPPKTMRFTSSLTGASTTFSISLK